MDDRIVTHRELQTNANRRSASFTVQRSDRLRPRRMVVLHFG
jgi:hypothetical protein